MVNSSSKPFLGRMEMPFRPPLTTPLAVALNTRLVDTSRDDNRWEVYAGGQRGGTDADGDETNVMDVSLLDQGVVELKLENRVESIELEGEEIIFVFGGKG